MRQYGKAWWAVVVVVGGHLVVLIVNFPAGAPAISVVDSVSADRWSLPGYLTLALLSVLALTSVYTGFRLWRDPRHLRWWFVGVGLAIVAVGLIAGRIGGFGVYDGLGRFGGYGWARLSVVALGALAVLDGLVRFSIDWKRVAVVSSVLALIATAGWHVQSLTVTPVHVATASVAIQAPVTALSRLTPTELRESVAQEISIIESFGSGWRSGTLYLSLDPWLTSVEATVVRDSYPVEFRVWYSMRYSGFGPVATEAWATYELNSYLDYREADLLREPRGPTSGSVISTERLGDSRRGHLRAAYGAGVVLLLMIIPWSWWRRPPERAAQMSLPATRAGR